MEDQQTSEEKTSQVQENNNSIFIGKKPIKNYLGSIKLQLKRDPSKIVLKARGKFISKAVDIAELAKRNPNFDLKTKDIKIDTEGYKKEENQGEIKVSVIEIILSK
jgi:archaea-specific DNA-binding protein